MTNKKKLSKKEDKPSKPPRSMNEQEFSDLLDTFTIKQNCNLPDYKLRGSPKTHWINDRRKDARSSPNT